MRNWYFLILAKHARQFLGIRKIPIILFLISLSLFSYFFLFSCLYHSLCLLFLLFSLWLFGPQQFSVFSPLSLFNSFLLSNTPCLCLWRIYYLSLVIFHLVLLFFYFFKFFLVCISYESRGKGCACVCGGGIDIGWGDSLLRWLLGWRYSYFMRPSLIQCLFFFFYFSFCHFGMWSLLPV